MRISLIAIVSLLACSAAYAGEQSFTYADLIKRMTSLEKLAELPVPGEKGALWSSYDRASKYDERTGKYINWDANGDGGGIIRKDGEQFVFAEMEGPGCIWRIWSAKGESGRVKIILDGQEVPAVDLPFAKYFTADTAPFIYSSLSYDLNKHGCSGQNLYFPIPYQKSCKIVADKDWGDYYQFTYETFSKGTRVPTFSTALATENAGELKKVDEFFQNQQGADPAGKRAGEKVEVEKIVARAGKTVRVLKLSGPEAITAIRVKINFKDREDQMAGLRKLAFAITWDKQKDPAVWAPLGDFFGTAPGENLYKSLPTGMTKDGYYAYWYMPFAKRAVVELVNDDSVDREVQFEIVHAPLGRPFEGLGYFHAKWHRDVFPAAEVERAIDWTILKTTGCGRFCGVMLHVWNPWGGWWGEGDEKFFVDGEKFPSTIGTGSEDYFGYAWCNPGLFQRPYHGQTMTQHNKGFQSVFRWHIVDNVPFQTGFEGCIEKYFTNDERATLYSCLVVWYLAPGGIDPHKAIPVKERHGYHNDYMELKVCGFKILDGLPSGNIGTQKLKAHVNGKDEELTQLWWTGLKQGNKLSLAVDVKKAGKYKLSLLATRSFNYGIAQFSLDGVKIGGPVDFYNANVVAVNPPELLGVYELSQGVRKLTIELVGGNEKAREKDYMLGLQKLIVEPAE